MSEINNNSAAEELNEMVEEVVDDATVMTVPIDETLSISGEAADAKAVGDALATKIGQGEALTRVTVNGVQSDSSGNVNITGANIPLSSASGAATIGAAMDAMNESLAEMETEIEAAVKSVNGTEPDENGDVTLEDPGIVKNVASSFSITSTQGTINGVSALKCGAMVSLQFSLTTSQVVPADGTLSATVSCDSSMLPVGITPGEVSLASVQKAKITTNGQVSATATERLIAGSDVITFYFTYMCLNR